MEALLLVAAVIGAIIGIRYLIGVAVNVPVDAASRAVGNWSASRRRGASMITAAANAERLLVAVEAALANQPSASCTRTPTGLTAWLSGRSGLVSLVDGGVRTSSDDPETGRRLAGIVLAAARTVDPKASIKK